MGSTNFRLSSLLILFFIIAGYSDVVVGDCMYGISVQTGNIADAGTDAIISVTLGDVHGATVTIDNLAKWGLNGPSYDYFEQGNLDFFNYKDKADDCIDVCSISVTSDNSGKKPGWFLSYVEVTARGPKTKTQINFKINQWLALDEFPHSLTAAQDKCDQAKAARFAFDIVHAWE